MLGTSSFLFCFFFVVFLYVDSLYITVDTRYADMKDDFVVAQSWWVDLAQCMFLIYYFFAIYISGLIF